MVCEMTTSPDAAQSPLSFTEDDRLFHYTSAAGLFGILQSKCLWATHYQFLNDSKEFVAARASLRKYLERPIKVAMARLKVNERIVLEPSLDKATVIAEEAERLVSLFYDAMWGNNDDRIKGTDGYIFSCYCGAPIDGNPFRNGGLLNWSTYGKNGGYALQFNVSKLLNLLQQERERYNALSWILRRAVYAEEGEIPDLLRTQYDTVGQFAQIISEENMRGTALSKTDFGPMAGPLLEIMCLLKDDYFRLEKEARLVVLRRQSPLGLEKFHDLHIRHAGGVSVPYVKLFEGNLFGENCPLERIIIGPHADNTRRVVALRTYLKAQALNHIEITVSSVPYVSSFGS